MKTVITISIVMLLLAAGFIILNYDRADEGVKILNDDDYDEIISEEELTTKEKILEKFGNVGYEKGYLSNGEKVVEYKGGLKEYLDINNG